MIRWLSNISAPTKIRITTPSTAFANALTKRLKACLSSYWCLLKLGTVSLDRTKIKANASKHKALSWDYAHQLEAQFKQEIDTLMKLAEAADNTPLPEDMNVPAELKRRQDRLAVITKAKQDIQARAKARYAEEKAAYDEVFRKRRHS